MNSWTPRTKPEWLAAMGMIAVLGIVAILIFAPSNGRMIQCDGSVPTWMITEENEQTGCVELLRGAPPSDWDGSWVCIGLCLVPNPSPFFPDPESLGLQGVRAAVSRYIRNDITGDSWDPAVGG